MAFTRKHMNALAGMVASVKEAYPANSPVVNLFATKLADMLAEDRPLFDNNGNRRFDRARFLRACGVEQ